MKAWAAAAALLALGGAVMGAVAVGKRATASSSELTAALGVSQPKPSPAAALSTPAASAVASVAPAAAAASPQPVALSDLPALPHFKRTSTYNGAPVYVPEGCHGPYDLILHFHGAHPYVRDLVEKAGIPAVVAVFNAGNGAERYAQTYASGGMLRSLLRQVEMAAAPLCPGSDAAPRRIALSAWSAGYAAAEKLVAREEDRDRVDAVLLADGLHAGFTDRWKRSFAPNALQVFREYAALAVSGKKLFAITHSSIMTDGYASTTECSRLLLDALEIPPVGSLTSGERGSFSIEGSAGDDKQAHIAQFRQMDTALLSKLLARWSK